MESARIAGATALLFSLVLAAPSAFAQSKAPAAPPPPRPAAAPPPSPATPPPAAPPNAAGAPAAPPPAGPQPLPPAGAGNQPAPPYPYPVYPYPPYPYPYPYPYPPPYGYGYPPRPSDEPLPAEIDYEEGMDIPPGYQLVRKPRQGLVITGTVMMATGYGLAALVGGNLLAFDGDPEYGLLLIPLVGPFVTIAAEEYGEPITTGLMLFDGVTQLGGLAFLIAGFAAKAEVLERRDRVVSRPAPEFFVGPRSVGMRLKF